MNQKLKKYVIKSLAVLFSAASLLTAAAPQTFAGNVMSTYLRNSLANREQENLNERLLDITSYYVNYKEEHINQIRNLLRRGANVNAMDIFHKTPLIYAAAHHNYELCELFIRHGAIVNTTDLCGMTPLHALLNAEYNHDIWFQENNDDLFDLCELLINEDPHILNALDRVNHFSPIAYINKGKRLFRFLCNRGARLIEYDHEKIIENEYYNEFVENQNVIRRRRRFCCCNIL